MEDKDIIETQEYPAKAPKKKSIGYYLRLLFRILLIAGGICIAIPLCDIVIMLFRAMAMGGGSKEGYVFVFCLILLVLGIVGIIGLRKACKGSYYLHDGTADIFSSVGIGALNMGGIITIIYPIVDDKLEKWLALPGLALCLIAFIWAFFRVKAVNNEGHLGAKEMLLAASGRMFLLSLGALLSVLMVLTAMALRDTLKAKGSSASVRLKDALDRDLKSVRIWGRNLSDNNVVFMIALLGGVIAVGKKVWNTILMTRNERKRNHFTAFSFGFCTVISILVVYLGIGFSIAQYKDAHLPAPNPVPEQSEPAVTPEAGESKATPQSEEEGQSRETEPSATTEAPGEAEDSGVSSTPGAETETEATPEEPSSTESSETTEAGASSTNVTNLPFSLVPPIAPEPEPEEEEFHGPTGGERFDFQQKIGKKIVELERFNPTNSTLKLYRKRLLTLLPRIHQGESADFTLPETKGNTALHYACGLGDAELVEILLDWGANPRSVTDRGKTPMDCTGLGEVGRVRQLLAAAIQEQDAPKELTAYQTREVCIAFLNLLGAPHNYNMSSTCTENVFFSSPGVFVPATRWADFIEEVKKQWPERRIAVKCAGHSGMNVQMILECTLTAKGKNTPVVGYMSITLGVERDLKISSYYETIFGPDVPDLDYRRDL